MKKTIIYLLFFGLSVNYLQAEESDSLRFNELNLHVGYQNNYLKDDVFSPLNIQGRGIQFGLGYRRTVKNIFELSMNYGSGTLNVFETSRFPNSFLDINISLEYLAKLPIGNFSTKFYLGGAYETRALLIEWYGLDAFSYTSTQGLLFKGLLIKNFNSKHSIESSLGVPVFQWLGRPPYNGIDEFIIENQDNPIHIMLKGTPSSFGKYLALKWDLEYKNQITSRLIWTVDYSLFYQKVDDIHQAKRFSIVPSTGLTLKF